jgi:hypothetical protein
MQKANVDHGEPKLDKLVGRSELPCVRCRRSLYSDQVVINVVLISMERKSDEEAKKEQKKGLTNKK